jgi:hypothetical protein
LTPTDRLAGYEIAGLFDDDVGNTPTPLDGSTESTASNNDARPSIPLPFITKQVLTEIREDIASTVRPSWQAQLPSNFGCAEHGKLKADQWRTALEFNIPVSLVKALAKRRGGSNISEYSRAQRIVDTTMDLAIALGWGLSRRTSQHNAERYRFYMQRYLAGVQELFPDYALKPKHHYALHIYDILVGFGPLHGTWTFFLERLVGLLQRLNSNLKIGDRTT